MSKADIGISGKEIKSVVKILETVLATEVVFNMKIRNYHWNVTAPNFSELHKFFEAMYEESTESIDDIAERIRALWKTVDANYENFLWKSIIKEETENCLGADKIIENLLEDKESIIKEIRSSISEISENTNDMWSEDFLTGLIQAHEKNAWMLRSMV